MITRPMPSAELSFHNPFVPAPDVTDWIAEKILKETGELHNPDHKHLLQASICVLWTCVANTRQQRQVIGQAEKPAFRCGAWQKARQEMQIEQWFGIIPDFLITLDADYCREASDLEFAALVEHELYHCAQELDDWGEPKFRQDGSPAFAIRGHDVEEFIGVVARYGVGNPDGPVAKLVEAANRKPLVSGINIARACGTCQLKSA